MSLFKSLLMSNYKIHTFSLNTRWSKIPNSHKTLNSIRIQCLSIGTHISKEPILVHKLPFLRLGWHPWILIPFFFNKCWMIMWTLDFPKKILDLTNEHLVNILGGHGIGINIHGGHPNPRNGHLYTKIDFLLIHSYRQALYLKNSWSRQLQVMKQLILCN